MRIIKFIVNCLLILVKDIESENCNQEINNKHIVETYPNIRVRDENYNSFKNTDKIPITNSLLVNYRFKKI